MNFFTSGLPVLYLKPGEMLVSTTPNLIVTVLGSCLSVTMFHRRLQIGAICHGILPRCDRKTGRCDDCLDPFKYVDCSIRKMIEAFGQFHARPAEIEVKIFGGADMFGARSKRKGVLSIGKQNVLTAEKVFASERLRVLATDTGGLQGRKIFFFTQTGEVLLKRLKKGGEAYDAEEK